MTSKAGGTRNKSSLKIQLLKRRRFILFIITYLSKYIILLPYFTLQQLCVWNLVISFEKYDIKLQKHLN